MGKFTKVWNVRLVSIFSILVVCAVGLFTNGFFTGSETAVVAPTLAMGLFGSWTPLLDVGKFVTNVVGAVGNVATGVLNTTGGAAFANSMSGALGGKPMSGSDIGQLANSISGKTATSGTKLKWYQKFFNYYKLGVPPILVDQFGNETLNTVDKDGNSSANKGTKPAMDWIKFAIHISGLVLLILLIWAIFFRKKKRSSGGGSRRSRPRRRSYRKKGRY